MSGVVVVRCGRCLVWWRSYLTCGVVDVWCGGCLCGGCCTIHVGDTDHTKTETGQLDRNFDAT